MDRWTNEEVEMLKYYCNNHQDMTFKNIATRLGRSYRAVLKKCWRVELRKPLILPKIIKKRIRNSGNPQTNDYKNLHKRIRRRKPKPEFCEYCKEKNKWLDLANISGEYKQDVTDFEWLCRKCHMTKDNRIKSFNNKRNELIKKGIVQRNEYGRYI